LKDMIQQISESQKAMGSKFKSITSKQSELKALCPDVGAN